MKKKLLLFFAVLMCIFTLAACNEGTKKTTTSSSPSSTAQPTTQKPTTTATQNPTATTTASPTKTQDPGSSEYLEFKLVNVVFMYGSAFITFDAINYTDKTIKAVTNYSFAAYNDKNEIIYKRELDVYYFMNLGPKMKEDHLVGIEEESAVSYIKSVGASYRNFELSFGEIIYADNGNSEKLGKVLDVTVSHDTGDISWKSVDHANKYIIDINGDEYTSLTNSIYVPFEQKENKIKVKAVCDGYDDGDWSDEKLYVIDGKDTFNYIKLFVKDNLKDGAQFKELVFAYYSKSPNYHLFVVISKVELNGKECLIRMAYQFNNLNIDNYEAFINNAASADASAYELFDIMEYDTLGIMKDNNLDAFLSSMTENDYTSTVVKAYTTSYLTRSDGTVRYFVYAIYKNVKNGLDRVEYKSVIHTITVAAGENDDIYTKNILDSNATIKYSTHDITDLAIRIIKEDSIVK